MNQKLLISLAASFAIFSTSFMGKADADVWQVKTNPSTTINFESIQKCLQKLYTFKNIQFPKVETPSQENTPVETPKETEQPSKEQNTEAPKQEQKVPEVQPPAQKPTVPDNQNSEQPKEQPTSYTLNAFEQQVVDLTNQERAKQGLAPLKVDIELSKVAREKSKDMAINNYFSHTSPTYGSPFDMMKKFGISYTAAGENIAKGQRSPQEVVNAWMNSSGHRANILNPNFTHIGVGFVDQGYIWTQQFIRK